jgi:hypothetical protein
MITTNDEFNNTNKIDEEEIQQIIVKIQPNLIKSQISSGLLQMDLDQTYIDQTLNTYCDSDLSSLTEDVSSILNSGSCCKRYVKEVKLSEPKIVN